MNQPPSAAEPAGPTASADRIVALDVLRGFAVLGILLVNIQAFSMVGASYMNPSASGRMGGLDTLVWGFTYLFFDQKFMTLFTLLFGAGIVLMTTRAEATGRSPLWLHYRRNFWLLVIGLIHAYVFWTGDILVFYAIGSFWVVWFRRLRPRWLIALGILILSVSPLISLAAQVSLPSWGAAQLQVQADEWAPPPEVIDAEIAAMRGGFAEQFEIRIPDTLTMHTVVFLAWGFWRVGGLFLIGMAFFKLGIATGERETAFYRRLALACLPVGWLLTSYGLQRNLAAEFEFSVAMFGGSVPNYVGSALTGVGYLAVVMLAVRSGWLPGLQARLAACGQMALTNYLTQTLICTFLFYGHGLGWFETLDRSGQLIVVVAIWGIQLLWSPWWMARYRFGPFEWAWRSLTYMRLQPMARAA